MDVIQCTTVTSQSPLTVYVLNAAAITKLHAVEHLAMDLVSYKVDIAVVSETHLKWKQPNNCFTVNGYNLFRHELVDASVEQHIHEQ